MQHLFHVAPGAAEAVEVDVSRLGAARTAGGWIWLDVTEFIPGEVHEVAGVFGFDPLAVQDVLDWSEYPKVDDHADYTFIVGHGISTAPAERLETTEYDVFLGVDYVVTFHQEDLPGFRWGREHIVASGSMTEGSPDILWGRVAEAEAGRFKPIVDGLDLRIGDLEDRAIVADPTVPADVLGLRRDVQTLRQIVVAEREVFREVARGELVGITRRGARRLGHVFDDFSRLAEILDGARLLLGNVLDTYRGTVAERANEVMKVLTVFAAIVLPLSLLAGIYGMNFSHMPELAWRWGYAGLIGVMVVVGVGLWSYFSRRGFIGGPRLSRVPGAVGKGLVDLVKLTTKPATMLLHLATRPPDGRNEGESG